MCVQQNVENSNKFRLCFKLSRMSQRSQKKFENELKCVL